MPTLVALQRSPALPPIGPPPPYPRKTNRTPSLNPPAILAIHPQAPFGDAVSPLVDGDGSSVFGVAVGGGTDVLSGGDDSGDQVDPYEVDNDFDGFSDEVDDDKDYSGVSEDDDKKASDPNCLDYSTDEDDDRGGPHEKMSFFQIASGPILSIPIHLKTCLYGPCKFSLKKMTPSLPTNPPKSAFFLSLVTGLVTD